MKLTDLVIPVILALFLVYGAAKGCDVFGTFCEGAQDGLKTAFRIAPTMVAILLTIGMVSASGGLDLLASLLDPVLSAVGIPSETIPLMLVRPISGSGALAVFTDLLEHHHPDSFVGRVASVMQGSTETTFYTIAVYYGATRVKNTRHTLGSALAGDMSGFVMSALAVSLLL